MSPYLINITFHRKIWIFVKNLTSLTIFYYTCLNSYSSIDKFMWILDFLLYIFKCLISKLIQIQKYPVTKELAIQISSNISSFQIMLYAHYWIVCTTDAKINYISVEYIESMKLNSFTQPNSSMIFSLFLSYYMYIWLLGVRFLYQLY